MPYRQLGKAGVQGSVIGLGTNRFGTDAVPQQDVHTIMDAAEDLRINFIDTADIYVKGRSEETLGKALKGRWDRFVLASKFSMHMRDVPNDWGTSRYHMMHAVEASLLAQPSVCSSFGAPKLEQMQHNAKAVDWMLTDEEMDEINTILKG